MGRLWIGGYKIMALVKNVGAEKTFKKITQTQDSTTYTVSQKAFSSITPAAVSSNAYTGASYYAFGTTFFMDDAQENPLQCGGLAFALGTGGKTGYFIELDTTPNAIYGNSKNINIFKSYQVTEDGVTYGSKTKLTNEYVNNVSTLNAVYGGRAFNIDVKIKAFSNKVEIKIWINGYNITAVDTYGPIANNKTFANNLIPITNNVGIFAKKGTCYFDYVYGMSITEPEWKYDSYGTNRYTGQFSKDLISMAFGDLNFQGLENKSIPSASIDEFGTTVRELHHVKLKFDSRPSMPVRFSTGNNAYASIVAQSLTNYEGEAFVLNNASTPIPLQDNTSASFYIIGNTIDSSGQLENVIETTTKDYVKKEPFIFESKWIQSNEDADALGNWIKESAINKGSVVDMEIFGNPVVSPGDVISIFYPYQGYSNTNTSKFIVNSVTHGYSENGLTTSISCRSL
jgi:hypothetical protein